MARHDRSPPMRDTWRAEDEARDRHSRRDRDRSARQYRSPSPRRASPAPPYRGRDPIDTDSYRPSHKRQPSPNSWKHQRRQPSPSPNRSFKPKQSHPLRSRPLEDRIIRPRDQSIERAAKRRRTQSPSPSRSDRWVPDQRRRSRSRDHYEPRDRPPPIDRAFSPRRSSPIRNPRTDPRDFPPEVDSYVPGPRRRSPTPPPLRRRGRSPSPPQRSRSPHRRPEKKKQPQIRELSPYSARVLKTKELEAGQSAVLAKTSAPQSKAPSVVDENEHMDGQYQMRGHGHRGGWNQNRPQRPYVDTRQQQYGGSPPFHGANSSYHGSPHSASPQYNRGGWNGPQGPG